MSNSDIDFPEVSNLTEPDEIYYPNNGRGECHNCGHLFSDHESYEGRCIYIDANEVQCDCIEFTQ